jgi:hypothetical protein
MARTDDRLGACVTLGRAQRLALVRLIHTAIYLVMASSVFVVLYSGITGAGGPWLWVAAGLVITESLVFTVSGMKCPLTAVAVRYGAGKGELFDTFLPERLTRYTLRVFGPLILLGFLLLGARWWFYR